MRTPGELRRMSLAAFDRTFAITYLLELVAVTIGLFGIAAGISAQVLARRSEFGALRHLGFTRGQVASMLAIEGSVLGALGVIVGLIAGTIISLILIYVVNRQSFHWSMDLSAPVGLLSALSAALIAAAALIAVVSGRQAMGGEVVRAVREDW
jgi:putative ABC transport system permease protein